MRGVIDRSISSGSMLPSNPTSANTGFAPVCRMVCTVEQNVRGVVITSSPLPIPKPARATCRPAVQEFNARACAEST